MSVGSLWFIYSGQVKSSHLSMEESVAGFGISSTLWQKSSRKRRIKRMDGLILASQISVWPYYLRIVYCMTCNVMITRFEKKGNRIWVYQLWFVVFFHGFGKVRTLEHNDG